MAGLGENLAVRRQLSCPVVLIVAEHLAELRKKESREMPLANV